MSSRESAEARELLLLQCKLARLKIDLERRKLAQRRKQESDNPVAHLLELTDRLPNRSLWKTVLLPAQWKHRAFWGAALLIFEYWRKRR
ncbi:MAG: hypothetical protein Q4A84_07590 [Neisseria sp.]|uniref:hypothetical protein n=1 Tax=Neisseria sp. TaxID=192066 RepID=UPI0026DD1B27|nr:hypothetical protein [Neisseria sp.]MDO4641547.1 hypothetical protein [Neisseria sp.]